MSVSARPSAPAGYNDVPRSLERGLIPSERVFIGSAFGIGSVVLLITGSIGVFLFLQLVPTVRRYGWSFFTQANWLPQSIHPQVGIAAAVAGTFEVAAVAIVVAVPLGLLTALYISEYAPSWLRGPMISMVDLMAAIPSIIYGLWGWFLLEPYAADVSRWLSEYFGWFPLFSVPTDSRAAVVPMADTYYGSVFIAGLVVSMMVTPIACSVMRGVFSLAPIGEREAALALGSTRWGVIRSVVLPFGRGGMIGGTMLGLGRALGETIAVLLIISPSYLLHIGILNTGTITVASLIAKDFSEASPAQLSALLAAGCVLFFITLVVNLIAAMFITRSRSGSATEI
jgi:phosphate transport system permease protein